MQESAEATEFLSRPDDADRPRFRPASLLTPVTIACLLGHVALAPPDIIANLLINLAYDDTGLLTDQEQADAGHALLALTALLQAPVILAAVIAFLMWIYRAGKNARALGADGMEFTPGWSVGWFFVPFANLVMPFRVVREIWRASDPRTDTSTDGAAWLAARAPTRINFWWLFWLGGNFSAYFSLKMSNGPWPRQGAAVSIFSSCLNSIAAILCSIIVYQIHARQRCKHRLMLHH